MKTRTLAHAGSIIAAATVIAASAGGVSPASKWWSPGQGDTLPAFAAYENASGSFGILNASGAVATQGHPFFEPLGTNGRACVTCHQPSDGMSLSAATARARWTETRGADPLFAAIDGANCPDAKAGDASRHSLMIGKGLVRVGLPWPPKRPDGGAIEPEFKLEVVKDPTGCNTSSLFGLKSAAPTVSVYRRPRVVANLRYLDQPLGWWSLKDGVLLPKDPAGRRLGNNIMADTRAASLEQQAADAMRGHLQVRGEPDPKAIAGIAAFEHQLYGAMVTSAIGGSLSEGGASAGPQALRDGKATVVGGFTFDPAFPEFEGWRTSKALGEQPWDRVWPRQPVPNARPGEERETAMQRAFRDSVARGYDLFMYRTFLIRDVANANDIGLGNPLKNSCVLCHNMQRMGADSAPGFMDLGTTTMPTADKRSDLPLFRLTCRKDVRPHPYLGRVVYTFDPGKALISGKCRDIGSINMQQFRGLAGRAPYFANGSAQTLLDVVEYYDRRFSIGYSKQDKQDLVNFMSVL